MTVTSLVSLASARNIPSSLSFDGCSRPEENVPARQVDVNAVLFRIINVAIFAEIKEFLTRPGNVDLLRDFFIEGKRHNQQLLELGFRDRLTTVDFQPNVVSGRINLDLGVVLFFRLAPCIWIVRIGLP